MTLFAVSCAGLFPILHLGRPWVFYWLFPDFNTMALWPQWRSPLIWDVFALSTYATLSLLFLYLGLLPHLSTLRDRANNQSSRTVYGVLSMGLRGLAAGRGERLKEFVVGVEVFGKPESFDPRNDPIVRVQARRLRAQLTRYYREEGPDGELLIELPKGGYAPIFKPLKSAPVRRTISPTLVSRNTAVVLPALLLGRAVDQVIALSRGETTPAAVTTAALLFIAGTLATEVPRIGKRWWLMTANNRIRSNIRADVFRGVVAWPMARLHRTPIGDLMARTVGDVEVLGVGVREFTIEIWDTVLFCISIVVAMLFFDPLLTVLALAPTLNTELKSAR